MGTLTPKPEYQSPEVLAEWVKVNVKPMSRFDWQKRGLRSYRKAHREGWLDEISETLGLVKRIDSIPVMCEQTGEVFESQGRAADWVSEVTGKFYLATEVHRQLIGKRKTLTGYTFRYVETQ